MRNPYIILLLILPLMFPMKDSTSVDYKHEYVSNVITERPIIYADSTLLLTEIKSFPTAEGGGKNSIGGRGGAVIFVNNATELRNALNQTYPRTIIFRSSGNYTASTNWNVPYSSPYVTVAGQTAPGDGVCLKGDVLEAKADHMIFRHFRIRPGDPIDNLNKTSLRIAATGVGGAAPIGNIIADHLSISWGADTNVSIGAIGSGNSVHDVTIQNCMISENISNGYNVLLWQRASNISFQYNLMAHSSARNVRSSTKDSDFEQVNNLLYSNGSNVQPTYENNFDVVGNVWITNPSVSTINEIVRLESCSSTNCPSGANINLTRAYINDNTLDGGPITVRSSLNPYLEGSPIFSNGLTYLPSSQVKDYVIANVGANLHRDSYDTQIINEVLNRNGSRNGTAPDGIYPTLASGSNYLDADSDGMEDNWETLNGLNPASASDRNNRPASMVFDYGTHTLTVDQSAIPSYGSVGYTALEFYLNYLAGDYEKLPKVGGGGGPIGDAPVIILNGASTVYYDTDDTYTELGATASDTEDGTLTGSIVTTGTINMASAGTYYKYYDVVDSDGNNATTVVRTVVVSQGAIHPTAITVTPSSGTISTEDTIQLLRFYTPSNSTIQVGVWSSSNENIAIVDHGLVTPTGNEVGYVDITYTANDGGAYDTSTILVTGDVPPEENSDGTGVSKQTVLKIGN